MITGLASRNVVLPAIYYKYGESHSAVVAGEQHDDDDSGAVGAGAELPAALNKSVLLTQQFNVVQLLLTETINRKIVSIHSRIHFCPGNFFFIYKQMHTSSCRSSDSYTNPG
jgi:hypothetical protein